jgi:polysaccharide biosynthesis/export protein
MIKRAHVLWLLALVFQWPSHVHAQELTQRTEIPEDARQLPEYQVGPGDVLSVRVFGLSQFDQNTRISNSGKIHVPYAGILTVANMTAVQVETEIAKKLRERQLVKEPWVRVEVIEYNAQPVFVVGEVAAPGQFVIIGDMRVLDMIAKAGGLARTAGEEAILIRRRSRSNPESKASQQVSERSSSFLFQLSSSPSAVDSKTEGSGQSIKINIADLTDGNHPELNARLQGGDILFIPKMPIRLIYIIGEVRLPGAYYLPRSYDRITAAGALSYAGGPNPKTAKTSKAFVVRRDQNGDLKSLQFDFAKAIKGEEPDIYIKPDDVIFMPRSVAKMTGYKFFDLFAHLSHQWMIF